MFHMIWSFAVKTLPSSYSQLNEATFTKTMVFCEGWGWFFFPFLLTRWTLKILYQKIDFYQPVK